MKGTVAALFILVASAVWSGGAQEADYQPTQGKQNFQQKVDLTALTPGEYNLLVRATDAAGNQSFAGPYNFYYDPASDNPQMAIANPAPGMRLGTKFYAVGVGTAPKGMASVEYQLDGGPWTPAVGKSFWSAPIDTAAIPDGLHRLAVRGTDVNGVVGPATVVAFHLDQKLPVLTLTSHRSGDRVSGSVELKGTLADGNGLASLRFSTNDQKTEAEVSLSGDSQADTRSFSIPFDTRAFPDGTVVVRFHATDRQGSESRQTFLLYVDNNVPVLTVLSPPAGKPVHGKVRFVVEAHQALGVQSLSARVGDNPKAVPLTVVAGNPFHVVDLDLPTVGTGTLPVVFEALDTAGKKGTTTYLAHLDGSSDLPTLNLAADWNKDLVRVPARLGGLLKATDGPGSVAWSVNGAPEVVQPVGKAFDFEVTGLATGANKVVLVPIDANGKRGNPVTLTPTVALGAPSVQWKSLAVGTKDQPFRPGLEVVPGPRSELRGTLTLANPVKAAVWSLDGGADQPIHLAGTTGVQAFALPFPDDPPFGTVSVVVKVTDAFDQQTVARTFVNVADLSRPRDPQGLTFVDPRASSSPVLLTAEAPLVGFFTEGTIRSVDVLSATAGAPAALKATHGDRTVTLTAAKDGRFGAVRLKVTNDKGRVYETTLGDVVADLTPPQLTVSAPGVGSWVGESFTLAGQASDPTGVAALEWSSDEGSHWQPLEAPKAGGFKVPVTLPGPDGAYGLLVRATDAGGRTTVVPTVVRKDTRPPTVEVTGSVLAVVRLRDEALRSGEMTVGKTTTPLNLERPVTLPVEAAGTTVKFHVVDWAGNVTDQGVDVPAAPAPGPEANRPQIRILFPAPDAKGLNGTVPVVGQVVGFGAPPTLTVKGESLADQTLTLFSGGYFTFDVDLGTLKNRNLSLTASSGKDSTNLGFTVPSDPASALPTASWLVPKDRTVATDHGLLRGAVGDSRGTVGWTTQVDGGPAQTVAPDPTQAPVGAFQVDLGALTPGSHRVTVTPMNARGLPGQPVTAEVVAAAPPGPVTFAGIAAGDSVVVTRETRLSGRLGGPVAWKSAQVRFADLSQADPWNGPYQPLALNRGADGESSFDAVVPSDLPYARIGVAVKAEDNYGRTTEGRTVFYRVWPKDPTAAHVDEGLSFVDDRLERGRVSMVPGQPLVGTFRGRPLASVTLVPPVAGVVVANDAGVVSLDTKTEGLFGPFQVTAVTVDGEKFSSEALTLVSDAGGPTLDWKSPQNADFIQDKVTLAGTVDDPSGLATLEVSVDAGATWAPVVPKAGRFDAVVPYTGPDGLVQVVLRATDKAGHTTVQSRALSADGQAPVWSLVAPPADHKVNGKTTLVGVATDASPIVSVEYSEDKKTFRTADGTDTFTFDLDFASYAKVPETFWIRTTDASGNQAVTPLVVPLDQEADKPTVQIQTPADGEVVRSDFVLSGMSFDDDGVRALRWRVDGGPWQDLDGTASFQIPLTLTSYQDNEHTVEVQAKDIYDLWGPVSRSAFKVSLAAPDATLVSPPVETTVNAMVGLVGTAADKNGVQAVEVSLDNGLTWNPADLKPKGGAAGDTQVGWEWRFDSRIFKDGTYLVMVRTTDRYATQALYTSLVNLDNTAPTLTLTSPVDGHPILTGLDLEGRVADNVRLVSFSAELRPVQPAAATRAGPSPAAVLTLDLPLTPTFGTHWDLGTLPSGWYNLRLEAKDAAGNTTWVARNLRLEGASGDKVELLFPQAGETVHASVLVEGRVFSRLPVTTATVSVDGKAFDVPVDATGAFSLGLDATQLSTGDHTVTATAKTPNPVTSEARRLRFEAEGPWVRVESHRTGAFVSQRPFLAGKAGWAAPPAGDTPEAKKEAQRLAELHRVTGVEVSLDNGKTFASAQGGDEWKFRLETLGLPDGPQPLVVRARFQDGSTAFQKLVVTVDQTPSQVALLTDVENGRFNLSLEVAGYIQGDVTSVETLVRKGDKAGYEVPQFIQGMYLDTHFLGATLWETGLGLTFFQEAVKLQAEIGQTPQYTDTGATNRFFGTVVGAKLIASVAQFPGGYYLGPDWSWLSSSFGVGANFAEFSMSKDFLDFGSASPVMLGGVVLQWETVKATFKDQKFFKSYSWYNEATVWFISSDVKADSIWTFSTGLRVGLF